MASVQILGEPDTIKSSNARRLVNRGLAAWIIRGKSIRRLTTRQRPLRSAFVVVRAKYIPEKLPPAELPGLRFQDSESSLINRLNSKIVFLQRLSWSEREAQMELPNG